MSELITRNDNRATIRWKLLTGASVLALLAYASSESAAKAEDADRPTIWIELGGQMDQVQGVTSPFIAPFMTAISPTPDVYGNDIFSVNQRPARLSFGEEGGLSFQPEGSDWIFSANIRYGRSHTNRHSHQQGSNPVVAVTWNPNFHHTFHDAPFADEVGFEKESHAILDFTAGRDVGLGAFGQEGASLISAGIRVAQFSSKQNVTAMGRPQINLIPGHGNFGVEPTFYNYTMFAHAERSFHGVGPLLSWKASAAISGNRNDGELTLDWGLNGAVLFGRQKAKTSHTTQVYHLPTAYYSWYAVNYYAQTSQSPHRHNAIRSRSTTVANVGGFVGMSMKYPNVKFSVGYRYDTFLKAMDTGIDAAKKSNVTFQGPYASISIGIGD